MIILLFSLLLIRMSQAMTEEEVARKILENFPLIEEARMKYEASKSEVDAARGNFDHKLTFKSRNYIEDKYDNQYFETTIERQTSYGGLALVAGHRQGLGTFPPYDGKYETSGAGEIFAGLTIPLLRNFQTDQMRLGLETSKIKKSIAKAELLLKKNIYLHKGLSAYYKWLYVNQKQKIRESVLKIAEERQSMLEQKYKAGDIDRLKVTDNQRSIDKRRDELAKTKIEWLEAKNTLSIYFKDESGNVPVIMPSQEIKTRYSLSFSQKSLPQMAIIEGEIGIKTEVRKYHAQSTLPGLGLDLLGAKELSGNVPYDPHRMVIGIKFDISLENRKAEGKTTAAEYKFRALQKEKEYLEANLKQKFQYSIEALEATKLRWEITNSEFEKTTLLSKAERRKWTQGASDLYIVNLREQDEAEADIKRWGTWLEYHQYHLDGRLYAGTLAEAF